MCSERLRVLFVCAMNKRRSVTAERLYCRDARLEVRSAGIRSEALRRVSEADLKWADVVFAMEREHKRAITSRFADVELPPIEVLDIPDDYECMDPELQEMLRMTLEPEFEARIGSDARKLA
jgi:protein-tyrosine phosphatase